MKGTRKGYLLYQKRYINSKGLGIGPRGGVSPHKNLLIFPTCSPNDLIYIQVSRTSTLNISNTYEFTAALFVDCSRARVANISFLITDFSSTQFDFNWLTIKKAKKLSNVVTRLDVFYYPTEFRIGFDVYNFTFSNVTVELLRACLHGVGDPGLVG